MSAEVLTSWGVVLTLQPDEIVGEDRHRSARHQFDRARDAYLGRCARLAAFLDAEEAVLRVTAEHVEPVAAGSWADAMTVGVSVVEVRPTSFDMAVRIRAAGDHAVRATNGRCTLAIERRATGERIPIARDVRDEFVAIQLAARELC